MDLSTPMLTPLISLIAGVVILIMPRLLNYIVALYLIVIGLLGLFPQLAGSFCEPVGVGDPAEHA